MNAGPYPVSGHIRLGSNLNREYDKTGENDGHSESRDNDGPGQRVLSLINNRIEWRIRCLM